MKVSAIRLRNALVVKGWDQARLAREAGLSRPYITQIMHGHRVPSAVALKALADALDTDVESLVAFQHICPICGHVSEI